MYIRKNKKNPFYNRKRITRLASKGITAGFKKVQPITRGPNSRSRTITGRSPDS